MIGNNGHTSHRIRKPKPKARAARAGRANLIHSVKVMVRIGVDKVGEEAQTIEGMVEHRVMCTLSIRWNNPRLK